VRSAALLADLTNSGQLTGALRVPNTAGDLDIVADLRTGRCSVSVEVAAPGEGRGMTRVNWLIRQLSDAPPNLRIDAFAHMARNSTSELLSTVCTDPSKLLPDPKADLRRFRVSATSQLGTKRGVGRGAFIDSILSAADGFYESVLQGLRPWVAKAPQLSKTGSAVSEAGIDTTVLPDEQIQIDSGAVQDTSELVSWDDAEETIEREREQFSDPFVAPPALSAESRFDLPAPLASADARIAKLEALEDWAEQVSADDLTVIDSNAS
jgi:hypothetical protein